MSQIPPALQLKEEDVRLMLACSVHLGTRNLDASMHRYVWKRRHEDGVHIIDIRKTWEKLVLAARVIAAIENPKDVCVVAIQGQGTPYAQRAILKFAQYVGCNTQAGRFTPGTFTNQIQAKYIEPRLLLATDPIKDHQPIREASYVNVPTIAFADTDASLRHIDIAIPCNNKSKYSIALCYWLLAREVLRLRDSIPRDQPWDVMVDMFVYRDPEEAEKADELGGTTADAYGQPSLFGDVHNTNTTGGQGTEWSNDEVGGEHFDHEEEAGDWSNDNQGGQASTSGLGTWDNTVNQDLDNE